MQLALSTWQEVEDYLRTQSGVIVPIGSVEQHGPNGLIGTDHLCAEVVAKGVGDRIGCAVAPTLAYGMSQHHLGFTGSATLRPSTLMLVVRDVVQSLAVHGFRRFFFINGHGGNVATVTAAFDEIYAEMSLGRSEVPVRCRMTFWSSGPRGKVLAEELYAGVNGHHATASEVSLAQYYQPGAIKHAQMTPKVAPTAPQFFEAADYRARFADGRIGSDPSLSSPEHGKRLYDAAVDDMVEAYQAFMAY
ncbi:MAG: amidase [Rhodospirillales bacterium 70-18]|nr:creatininase family protein [Rhodospirillales bacterium]OJY76306.1 MAG: amidase [Rhodospirillales bacterium 70-18]